VQADGTIDYKQFEINGPVQDIMWCGANDEVILVLSENGEVYRSRDRGASWKRMQSTLEQKGI